MDKEEKSQELKAAEEKNSQLQTQLDTITKQIAANKVAALAAKTKEEKQQQAAAAEKLLKEADIQSLLTQDKEKLEDLSNKELLDIVGEAVDTAMEANTEIATSKLARPLEELSNKINGISKFLLEKEVAGGLASARDTFPDFDKYKDDISEVFKAHPDLSPKEAYILAKAEKIDDEPPQHATDSEKPISLTTRSEAAQAAYDKAKKTVKIDIDTNTTKLSSRRQFRQSLSDIADRVISKKRQ